MTVIRRDRQQRDRARALRRTMTEAEKRLWSGLRLGQLGVKFRRQVPVGPYIADFLAHGAMLIVEVDGGQHTAEADAERTAFLGQRGFRILRFWNNEVLANTSGVLETIATALGEADPHPDPPPQAGEGTHGAAELPRATAVVPGGDGEGWVTLAYEDRHRRRCRLTTDQGRAFLLDLPQATELRHGDALVLEDGTHILVRAAPEPLMEACASDPLHLARLAWHVGNRHLAAEIHGQRLVLRRDHVIADMLTRLGAEVREIEAPFNPEGGAYGHGRTHGHDHSHSHSHSHDHDHRRDNAHSHDDHQGHDDG